MKNFYVIEKTYVGPNSDQHVDADRIEIRTNPAKTNSSHEVKLEGWCGTTNDWAVYAHGEYATKEKAEAYIAEKFGPVRIADEDEFPFGYEDNVAMVYRRGQYIPMDAEGTGNYCWEGIKTDITADTTDEQIDELIAQYEAEVNEEGYTLDKRALEDSMLDRRQELRDEQNTAAMP